MNVSTLIILIAVVICLALVVYRYHQKKNIRYHISGLQMAVDKIFTDTKGAGLTRNNFLRALSHYYNCSRKESLYLLGYAREHGIIKDDEQMITKA